MILSNYRQRDNSDNVWTVSHFSIRPDIKTVLHQDIVEAKQFVNRQVQAKLQKRNEERKS